MDKTLTFLIKSSLSAVLHCKLANLVDLVVTDNLTVRRDSRKFKKNIKRAKMDFSGKFVKKLEKK